MLVPGGMDEFEEQRLKAGGPEQGSLLVTSASLLVTSALIVVTRTLLGAPGCLADSLSSHLATRPTHEVRSKRATRTASTCLNP